MLKIQFDNTSNYIFVRTDSNGADVDPTPSLKGNFTQILIEEDQNSLNKTIRVNNTGDVNGWNKMYEGSGKITATILEEPPTTPRPPIPKL